MRRKRAKGARGRSIAEIVGDDLDEVDLVGVAQDAGGIVRPPGETETVGLMSRSRSHRNLPLRRHSSIRIPSNRRTIRRCCFL